MLNGSELYPHRNSHAIVCVLHVCSLVTTCSVQSQCVEHDVLPALYVTTTIPNVPVQCMLISQWRKWPEDTTDTQRVSHALLQGLASLVELGQERVAHSQDCPPDSRSQLQSLVCRHKVPVHLLQPTVEV